MVVCGLCVSVCVRWPRFFLGGVECLNFSASLSTYSMMVKFGGGGGSGGAVVVAAAVAAASRNPTCELCVPEIRFATRFLLLFSHECVLLRSSLKMSHVLALAGNPCLHTVPELKVPRTPLSSTGQSGIIVRSIAPFLRYSSCGRRRCRIVYPFIHYARPTRHTLTHR